MLPSSSWGKRKLRGRLGWVRSDARGVMWARQEGLHHPHPNAVIRCPSSSSSSVSCSGKGLLGCPCPLPPLGSLPLLLSSPASSQLPFAAAHSRRWNQSPSAAGVPSPSTCTLLWWGLELSLEPPSLSDLLPLSEAWAFVHLIPSSIRGPAPLTPRIPCQAPVELFPFSSAFFI